MEQIKGQRLKNNPICDDPIAESDSFYIALDEVIKPLDVDLQVVKEINEALITAIEYPVPAKGYDNSILYNCKNLNEREEAAT